MKEKLSFTSLVRHRPAYSLLTHSNFHGGKFHWTQLQGSCKYEFVNMHMCKSSSNKKTAKRF